MEKLIIGSRGSKLATKYAEIAKKAFLKELDIEIEIKKLIKIRLNDRASSSWNELRMLKKEKLFLKDRINFLR